MKVRFECNLSARDGERSVVRSVDMVAPPSVGLHVVGRGWDVEVERVSLVADSGEYRVSCATVRDEQKEIADLVRTFEIEGWRAAAAK